MSRLQHEAMDMTATGRLVVVQKVASHSSLLKLGYGDSKGGVLPAKYAGTYTGLVQARVALRAFVSETWDVAEENTKTRKRA